MKDKKRFIGFFAGLLLGVSLILLMAAALPVDGGSDDAWGGILNEFLEVSHDSDGTLLPAAIEVVRLNATSSTPLWNTTPTGAATFQDLDLSAIADAGGTTIGANSAIVLLEVEVSVAVGMFSCRTNGTTGAWTVWTQVNNYGGGINSGYHDIGDKRYYICLTDSSGVIEWGISGGTCVAKISVLAFIR